jgi:hypothetical protein
MVGDLIEDLVADDAFGLVHGFLPDVLDRSLSPK